MATSKEQHGARPRAIVTGAFEQRREREQARAREAAAQHGEAPASGAHEPPGATDPSTVNTSAPRD